MKSATAGAEDIDMPAVVLGFEDDEEGSSPISSVHY
jgi:hypothetical protein